MVEARQIERSDSLDLNIRNLQMEDIARMLGNANLQIQQAMKNAKIQEGISLGLLDDADLEMEDDKIEQKMEQEMQRLLDGGIPFCRKQKQCSHSCAGVKGETKCLPCLEPECMTAEDNILPQNDELCTICYTSELKEEPSV